MIATLGAYGQRPQGVGRANMSNHAIPDVRTADSVAPVVATALAVAPENLLIRQRLVIRVHP